MLSHEGMRIKYDSDSGLSLRELAYQAVQATDFCHLYRNHGIDTQLGGSDQWGNISTGLHVLNRLVPKNSGKGLTLRLLEGSDGKKIGKSSRGTLWLDDAKTSPYDIYQVLAELLPVVLLQSRAGVLQARSLRSHLCS